MKITEVRIKLMDSGEDRLRGFCSSTFDDAFVVRDLKIIEGNNGPFVAMPSRKLTSTCPKCHTKNHLRSNYCNNCGKRLPSDQVSHDAGGRAKLYADIAHPVNAECREMIQERVIRELEMELERSRAPGYFSRYDDGYDGGSRKNHLSGNAKSESAKGSGEDEKNRSGFETRLDSAHESGQDGPHPDAGQTGEPARQSSDLPDNRNISPGRSKPAAEEFGKGIFD